MDNTIPHPLWRVELMFDRVIDGALAEAVSAALEDHVLSVQTTNIEVDDGDNWRVAVTTYGPPDVEMIYGYVRTAVAGSGVALDASATKAEALPECDWLQHVHRDFPPVTVGRFFIYGAHYDGAVPAGLVPLRIDAATAFGSGEHETTRCCLLLMEALQKQSLSFDRVLDMGCGSGILGIAARKLWPDARIIAVDIDPESVIVTHRHADMNGVTDIHAEEGDGYRAGSVAANGPYDLIVSNILAGPLIEMAGDLSGHLQPRGYAVLAGLLQRQTADVVAAHAAAGLALVDSKTDGAWEALLLQKS